MTTISAKLRAAILGGAVGLLPSMAFADSGSSGTETGTVPDHAAAEARSVGDTSTSPPQSPAGVPDHAAAEARSAGETVNPSTGATEGVQDRGVQDHGVPDHATAERRGAPDSD
jgi:hypothetical protein